jgi:hypothetical protein
MDKTGVEMLMNNDLELPRPEGVRIYVAADDGLVAVDLTETEARALAAQLAHVLREVERLRLATTTW